MVARDFIAVERYATTSEAYRTVFKGPGDIVLQVLNTAERHASIGVPLCSVEYL